MQGSGEGCNKTPSKASRELEGGVISSAWQEGESNEENEEASQRHVVFEMVGRRDGDRMN